MKGFDKYGLSPIYNLGKTWEQESWLAFIFAVYTGILYGGDFGIPCRSFTLLASLINQVEILPPSPGHKKMWSGTKQKFFKQINRREKVNIDKIKVYEYKTRRFFKNTVLTHWLVHLAFLYEKQENERIGNEEKFASRK